MPTALSFSHSRIQSLSPIGYAFALAARKTLALGMALMLVAAPAPITARSLAVLTGTVAGLQHRAGSWFATTPSLSRDAQGKIKKRDMPPRQSTRGGF